jgi:hypothetical protein
VAASWVYGSACASAFSRCHNAVAISGNDLVAGDGIIIAALSGVAGLGEVGEPTMPVPDPMPGSYPGTVMWINPGVAAPVKPPPPWWLGEAA